MEKWPHLSHHLLYGKKDVIMKWWLRLMVSIDNSGYHQFLCSTEEKNDDIIFISLMTSNNLACFIFSLAQHLPSFSNSMEGEWQLGSVQEALLSISFYRSCKYKRPLVCLPVNSSSTQPHICKREACSDIFVLVQLVR